MMTEEKLGLLLAQRKDKEFELLAGLPKDYRITTKSDKDKTLIEVKFDNRLPKRAQNSLPCTFEFLITLDHYYPLIPPLLQILTKVFFLSLLSFPFLRFLIKEIFFMKY